jgi:predicted  nucleic acid-binding Zn-ribbon protein
MNIHAKEDRMLQDLDKLLKLQVIDYDLGELERSKEYLPDMMDNLKREMTEAQLKYETATSDLEDGKIRQKNLELEISTKEAELQKYQQQMMSIKTNKEYDALVSEIDSIKGNISNFETELLETIDLIGDLEKNISEYEEKYNQIKDNNSKQLDILQQKIDSIGDKVSAKNSERKELSSSIPRQLISIYDRVRRGKGGSAVVAVKKRACGACYKAQTPKKIQDIRKGDRIFTCDNCGRLLYWDDDESR